MKVTHLGHSCLVLEYDDARILLDPGNLSSGFEDLQGLDAILVTHQHPDHLDPQRLPALLSANPNARLIVEPDTMGVLKEQFGEAGLGREPRPLADGEQARIGSVLVSAGGGRHAVIHRDLPRIGNVGLTLQTEGEPTFFHPGDSLETVPRGVDVLGVPVSAPWCAVKETVDFVRAVGAPRVVPIHDAVVSARGRPLYLQHISNLGGCELVDLSDREPTDL